MSFAQVFLRHHTALATACFVGGASYGLYSTLSHGYAPFGLWGSQGQPAATEQRAFTLRLR
ncbi:hypothetical protein C2E20_2280 [Micractinium conductrix]|uniref:Uncharacterized protein n=1 Tax=Micractinium conductrix TaxID=554055 RepID=A0A2P6VK84_9CHLO|nr:hypothetical protein C2E20_2280 [Micractinium conductrix]|eukprot:PSC74477.1 hypothetical protein C2E20_2280 [Micractinium conductrix]